MFVFSLISRINPSIFTNPKYETLLRLKELLEGDYYNPDMSKPEITDNPKRQEAEENFLVAVLDTDVMAWLLKFVRDYG